MKLKKMSFQEILSLNIYLENLLGFAISSLNINLGFLDSTKQHQGNFYLTIYQLVILKNNFFRPQLMLYNQRTFNSNT